MESNYFNKKYSVLIDLFNTVIENYQTGIWETKEGRDGFRNYIIQPYVYFIYNLNYLNIQSSSPLYKQIKFSDRLVDYCKRFEKEGIKSFVTKENFLKFVDEWNEHVTDWSKYNLDAELKKEEAIHYRKLAFSNGHVLNDNSITKFERDKEDALFNIKNKLNKVNLG